MASAAKPTSAALPALRVVASEWALRDGLEPGEERAGAKHDDDATLMEADLALVLVGPEDRPLQGVAGFIDWRSDGRLTRLLSQRSFVGEWGERLLCPETSDMPFTRLVMHGTGDVGRWEEETPRALARELVTCARKLRSRSVAVGWVGEDNSESRWSQVFDALVALLRHPPEFAPVPEGLADIHGAEEVESAGLCTTEAGSKNLADAGLPQPRDGEDPREAPADSRADEVEPGAAFTAVEGEDAPEATLGAVETALEAEQWWIIAPEALCTRLRGRLLGTPRPAEAS